jgi:hypothetical protein
MKTGDTNAMTSKTTGASILVPSMVSSGAHMNIEKLQGVKNYGIWKFQMRVTRIDCGLWDCIHGTEPVDSSRDQQVYAKICLCVQIICYTHVRNAKTAKEAWNNLKTAYENQGISRRLASKRKLSRIRYENFESTDLYLG